MNYYIEKHDMNIILDALETLHNRMKTRQDFGLPNDKPFSIEDVDGLFQSFDNSHYENQISVAKSVMSEDKEVLRKLVE